jgi:phospholipase/carboxylesterase
MQRTEHCVPSPAETYPETVFQIESALFSPPAQDTTYALFAPLHYESGYAYPLIVWLHGRGNDERQLLRIMPQVSMRNYVAIAPRGLCGATAGTVSIFAPAKMGLSPSEGLSPSADFGWRQTDEDIQQAEQRVFDCIAAAEQKLHVSPQRVFLAGFDCGGTMAFRLAMNRPERFAGVLSLGGPLPAGRSLFGNLVLARRLPMFLAAGRHSAEYPAEAVCDNLRLLHSAGMSVTLRQYPCGHELTPQMLGDVDRWIIEQITAPCPTSADPAERQVGELD